MFRKVQKLKIGALLLTLLILTPTVAGIVMVTNSNSGSLEADNKIIALSPELSDANQEASNFVIKIGDVNLAISIVDPGRHLFMVFETNSEKATLETKVSVDENGKYQTSILLNGKLCSYQTLDSNILEPISIAPPNKISQPASVEGISGLTPQYTYSWWDGVKQVTGPSYLIAYHHPDRTYYQIATFRDWGIVGNKANHNQINHNLSQILAAGGWMVIFGAIGAAIGGAGGALLGSVFGYLFGYATQGIILDEEGCIFWWCGIAFFEWFNANAWWLVWNPFGWGATIAQFLSIGYLRIGSQTLWDAPAIGNP
jgi:hypothetical protein